MQKKYEYKFIKCLNITDRNWYIYNVYRIFLKFIKIPVFTAEGWHASECRDKCREYILQHQK